MRVNVDVQVLCCDQTEYRGIQYYTIDLIKALVDRGKNEYSVSFFVYDKERGNRNYVENALSDVLNKIKINECNTFDYRKVINGLRKNDASEYDGISYEKYVGVDADLFYFPDGTRLPWNVPIGKTVVTIHDVIPLLGEELNGLTEDFILRFRNSMNYIASRKDIAIVTDSISSKNDLVRVVGVDENRIRVIYASFSKDKFYPDKNMDVLLKYDIDSPYVLYLGALAPHKGVDTLIKAADLINSDVKIVLAGGKTPEYDVETAIANSDHKDRFILTGFVSEEEKRVLYSNTEVFVFPSSYEGFGLPVLEAMACGAPVITSDVSSLPEVGGEAAIYIKPRDSENLAREIDRIVLNPVVRDNLSRRGQEHVRSFSWNMMAEQTERVFMLKKQVVL